MAGDLEHVVLSARFICRTSPKPPLRAGMLYVIPAFAGKFVLGSFVPGKDGGRFTGGFSGNFDDALVRAPIIALSPFLRHKPRGCVDRVLRSTFCANRNPPPPRRGERTRHREAASAYSPTSYLSEPTSSAPLVVAPILIHGTLVRALQVVGWAMVTRGELGFLMAQSSFNAKIMGAQTYVACIWALFVCTLVPPLIFGW